MKQGCAHDQRQQIRTRMPRRHCLAGPGKPGTRQVNDILPRTAVHECCAKSFPVFFPERNGTETKRNRVWCHPGPVVSTLLCTRLRRQTCESTYVLAEKFANTRRLTEALNCTVVIQGTAAAAVGVCYTPAHSFTFRVWRVVGCVCR